MNLAIFDIDGTLTHSTHVDDRCYVQAVQDVFGITGFSTQWLDYRFSTDSGILQELLEKYLGRRPDAEDRERFQQHFLGLLHAAVQEQPELIAEVPGAIRLLPRLQAGGRWQVAIATGTWRRSATFKLEKAGIAADGIPLATANDGLDRVEIIEAAVRQTNAAGNGAPGKRVYVGDALWDLRAARRLGIGFLGVAVTGDRQRLLDAGAGHVVTDFSDLPQVLEVLEIAAR